jgi:hypothetical protein
MRTDKSGLQYRRAQRTLRRWCTDVMWFDLAPPAIPWPLANLPYQNLL